MAESMKSQYLRKLEDGGSNTLNIVLGTATGVIILVILGLCCHSKRKSKQRREARRLRRERQGIAASGIPKDSDVYMEADNRTINLPMMGHQHNHGKQRDEQDIYIMRNSEDVDYHGNHAYQNISNPAKMSAPLPFKMDATLLKAKVDYTDIQYTRKLSKGAFGEVWLGQFQGNYVAIKQILEERKTDAKEIECFVAEIKLMATFQHPNIVDFLGFSWNPKDANLCAMTEYMKNGDLFVFLQKRKATLTWQHDKLQIAIDIAQALVYLHSLSPKVIHRDLKSKNVLLDDRCTAKLSDFGISRLRQLEETMTAGVGTALWAAPEVFLAKKYNDRADVYSLGVVLSELDTCAIPYADQAVGKNGKLDGMAVVKLVTQQKAKPTFSESCPQAVRALAFQCLDYEPDNRPSAAEVVEILKNRVRPALERTSY
ncbi:TKL protein kinase [Aphanomyces invadans]|uniref:TKL protein kinase n=1 Tax=Aphanomyces invadans TaxID=157072 RepID=A0A024TUD7_9STRA|nr:TKL protein kinase [Aphanomyces invadans]ETV97609.1 TKL protein kinase [Aphanomyces invadans]|eukprot:XP_008873818.1 TKL protein kinase [Aphanomyces invadans]